MTVTTFVSFYYKNGKRKAQEQSNKILLYGSNLVLNTTMGVGRIIDDLINMFDFQNKLKIVVSDILSSIANGLSESETESKQKK